jgi:hypothetical protein
MQVNCRSLTSGNSSIDASLGRSDRANSNSCCPLVSRWIKASGAFSAQRHAVQCSSLLDVAGVESSDPRAAERHDPGGSVTVATGRREYRFACSHCTRAGNVSIYAYRSIVTLTEIGSSKCPGQLYVLGDVSNRPAALPHWLGDLGIESRRRLDTEEQRLASRDRQREQRDKRRAAIIEAEAESGTCQRL